MNQQRLNELYTSPGSVDNNDLESLKQLTVDYPYFRKPFVILAKHYYATNHYKFEDMLRQAAMRVKDRKALYEYIHGKTQLDVINEIPEKEIPAVIETVEESNLVGTKPGLEDFLTGSEPETNLSESSNSSLEEPLMAEMLIQEQEVEFEFEGSYKGAERLEIAEDMDIIGEEINAEFSFSKSFLSEDNDSDIKAESDETEVSSEPEVEDKIKEETQDSEDVFNHLPEMDLRKHPVYTLEEFGINKGDEVVADENESGPRDFFAWLKHPKHEDPFETSDKKEAEVEKTEPKSRSLDIIEKFIAVNPQISRPKKEFYNPENMAKRSEVLDLEFVSETLANIYYEQGNYDLAIKAYEKLGLQNSSKQAYFASLIEKINKERK